MTGKWNLLPCSVCGIECRGFRPNGGFRICSYCVKGALLLAWRLLSPEQRSQWEQGCLAARERLTCQRCGVVPPGANAIESKDYAPEPQPLQTWVHVSLEQDTTLACLNAPAEKLCPVCFDQAYRTEIGVGGIIYTAPNGEDETPINPQTLAYLQTPEMRERACKLEEKVRT